jgi:hypothetical protein
MTHRTSAWSLFADDGPLVSSPAAATPRVTITPNRLQVDRRFPVLGFTIDTGGLPYFEVLLTTDRALFDPAQAGRRSTANFYASRQDTGLQRAGRGNAVWLAPNAVIRAFAGAARVYFTAIGYADARGSAPVLTQPLAELATTAPSVDLSADLGADAAPSMLFGASATRLAGMPSIFTRDDAARALADDAEDADFFGQPTILGNIERDDEEERAIAARAASWEDDDDAPSAEETLGFTRLAAGDFREDEGDLADDALAPAPDDYDDGFDGPIVAREEAWARDDEIAGPHASPTTARASRGAYHDEADDAEMLGVSGGVSPAFGATFPAGTPAPDMLWDEDDDPAATDESHEQSADAGDEIFALDDTPEFEALDAPPAPVAPAAPAHRLEVADMRDIVRLVAPFESGARRYAAVNADGEYEGAFGQDHPAYHRWHVGLSYGIVQFTQDSGSLGRLLAAMRDRDPAQFANVFGSSADELVRVTNLSGPPSKKVAGGRSARVQPVAGADLWMPPWRARFEQAASHVPFQAAQNQLAAEIYLLPILPFARWLGLDTQRALAIVYDRAVQMGPAGARRWLIEAVGPVQTPAQRQAALAALGHADVRSFQAATPGLDVDGDWGPLTHAAMVSALRALGDRSPLPVPTREQMLDAIERRAAHTPWADRVRALRRDAAIGDEPFTF